MGVNTTAPEARLDVSGTVILGTNDTAITDIIKLTVLHDLPPILSGTSTAVTIPVTNCNLESSVLISPQNALNNGIIIAYARVSVAGTVEVKFTNTWLSDIKVPPMNYYITVIR